MLRLYWQVDFLHSPKCVEMRVAARRRAFGRLGLAEAFLWLALAPRLADPKVKAYFQTLDVDVQEGTALFHILDNGDGEAGRSGKIRSGDRVTGISSQIMSICFLQRQLLSPWALYCCT